MNTVVVSPDLLRKEILGSVNNQDFNPEIWKITLQIIIAYLKNGMNVVLDATNTDTEKRKGFIKEIESEVDFKKIALVFKITPEESKRRIAKDIQNKVDRANVSRDAIDIQHQFFMVSVNSLPAEGFKIVTKWCED